MFISIILVLVFAVQCFNDEVDFYLHEMNVMNDGDNVFTWILSVVLLLRLSLHHLQIVYCL